MATSLSSSCHETAPNMSLSCSADLHPGMGMAPALMPHQKLSKRHIVDEAWSVATTPLQTKSYQPHKRFAWQDEHQLVATQIQKAMRHGPGRLQCTALLNCLQFRQVRISTSSSILSKHDQDRADHCIVSIARLPNHICHCQLSWQIKTLPSRGHHLYAQGSSAPPG